MRWCVFVDLGRTNVGLATLLIALSCASEPTSPPGSAGQPNAPDGGQGEVSTLSGITYWEHIWPIYQTSCTTCHSDTGVGPFPLQTYAQAKATAPMALAAVEQGRMPPWGAESSATCQPRLGYAHDVRLSALQKQHLASWVATGMQQGDPNKKPIVTINTDALVLKNVDQVAVPKKGFVASGSKDQFRCFVLDAEFPQDKYLNAVQVLPGNPLVAHHALLYLDSKAESLTLANQDGQYDCFGNIGVPASLLAAWAPGGVPSEYPPDAGSLIPKGSRLVLQVHYHPTGTIAESDLTKVQLRFTSGQPKVIGLTVLIGNYSTGKAGEGLLPGEHDLNDKAEFRIPAEDAEHIEEMVYTVPKLQGGAPTPDLRIHAIGGHMHYLGTNLQVSLERIGQEPPCSKGETQDLQACLAANCSALQGVSLTQCAQADCAPEVAGLGALCLGCLQQQISAGQEASAVLQACNSPAKEPDTQPAQECLLHIPRWDFNWQRLYRFDGPFEQLPMVRGGDKLRLRCTYNNSLNNPFVAKALADVGLSAPVDVGLGAQTLDEMCLAIVQVLYKP